MTDFLAKKRFLVFFCILMLGFKINLFSQAVVINEYCVTNSGANTDINGNASDWVEIYNAHTSTVNLGGWYLSNERNNVFKYKIPNTFTLAVGGHGIIWLTGKNTVYTYPITGAKEHHANFDITQCKSQWLILSSQQGVLRDSIFVRPTQYGHYRTRELGTYNAIGNVAWRVSTLNTFATPNPTNTLNYKDYLPTPTFSTSTNNTQFGTVGNGGELFILTDNSIADSTGSCFEVRYELDNGLFPINGTITPFSPVYTGTTPGIFLNTSSTLIRAVNYPKPWFDGTVQIVPQGCTTNSYLPSWCATKTFFQDPEHLTFQQEFGVIAVTMHSVEANWYASGGTAPSAPAGPTIHVEYFDNKNLLTSGYGIISKPVIESWKTKQYGYEISIDDRRGLGCNFNGQIFNVAGLGASTRTTFPTLHLKAGDIESHSPSLLFPESKGTGIRDILVQSIAAKNNLPLSPLHIKPVVMFLNGKYQGVYDLREVYDKHYENFYYKQSKDSLCLSYSNQPSTGEVEYQEFQESPSNFQNTWNSTYTIGVAPNIANPNLYANLFNRIDKSSFMDYMIFNSYFMNSNLWNYNIAFGKGAQNVGRFGNKYHYYLWNMPAVLNFSTVATNTLTWSNPFVNICAPYSPTIGLGNLSAQNYNGHGNILANLLLRIPSFRQEYLNRYQDLLNGPLRCDNVLAQFNYIKNLYKKEMKYHESPGSTPQVGAFATIEDQWDTNMVKLERVIQIRCDFVKGAGFFSGPCNNTAIHGPQYGPYGITVDVEPADAGVVRLNSTILPNYKWSGTYYQTNLPIKAIPTSTNYVFHHWEFKNSLVLNNSIIDTLVFPVTHLGEEIIAVFTDKTRDIMVDGENMNIPNAFSPNGDGVNDEFKPLGSALWTDDYDFKIFNRWGQEVFRSSDPTLGWDGNFEGQKAPTGVYAFLINYKNLNKEARLAKGNVTLVR